MDQLEFERLLNPISLDNPCGESLRWDPVWSELSQLRKTRKDLLDSSADTEADWPQVMSLSSDLLATRTKDLLIAGWLTEALVREHGFAGLRDGLRLIRQLIERYWDGLFPQIEDGDISLRAAPLAWLAEKDGGARLPATLRTVALAESMSGAIYDLNFWHFRISTPHGNEEDASSYEARVAEAESRKAEFDDAANATPLDFYRALYAELDECLQEVRELSTLTDEERLGDYSMSWSNVNNAIAEIQVFVRDILQRRGGLETANDDDTVSTETPDGQEANSWRVSGPRGTLGSRAEAIARLEEVARYFSTMDPHSPVAFLIRRAVRWANMSFEDLLAELVKDENTLKHVTETLGIGGTYGGGASESPNEP